MIYNATHVAAILLGEAVNTAESTAVPDEIRALGDRKSGREHRSGEDEICGSGGLVSKGIKQCCHNNIEPRFSLASIRAAFCPTTESIPLGNCKPCQANHCRGDFEA